MLIVASREIISGFNGISSEGPKLYRVCIAKWVWACSLLFVDDGFFSLIIELDCLGLLSSNF
jgi:hypothetical protein